MRREEVLFLKKKNQKNFCSASRGVGTGGGIHPGDKSFFASFFSKKEVLASYASYSS
jgi:hypothetical protein